MEILDFFIASAHAALMYARGQRVVVVDWQRTPVQMFCDLLLVTSLLGFFYQAIALALPFPDRLILPSLDTQVVDGVAAKTLGTAVLTMSVVIYGVALRSMGDSWRMGIDREGAGPLVTDGIFAWSRNPIYLALDLFVIGTFLLRGRLFLLVLSILIVALIHEQARREELFLADTHGETYRDYAGRVGRYVSWRRLP